MAVPRRQKKGLSSLIDRYRFFLADARGLARNTIQAYAGDGHGFLDWLDGEDDDLDDMRPLLLRQYVAHLSGKWKRRSTLARHVSAVLSFHRFLTHHERGQRRRPHRLTRPGAAGVAIRHRRTVV